MKKYLPLLLIYLVTACAPVANPTPTITATAVPTPFPVSTPIPLSELDIELLLIAVGDLPEGMAPDTITNENAVGSVDELDRADAVHTQYFLLEGGEGGGVSVFLFESLDDVQAAFDKVSTLMDEPSHSNAVGEQTIAESFFIPLVPDVPAIEGSRLAFSRCHALVVIQFPRADDMLAIARYGQRLDERLQPLVCREN